MHNEKFTYTYSASTEEERREIEDIKKQYTGEKPEKDKLARLRELDARVKNPPVILGICLGVIGALVFGTGLTMVLEWNVFAWGVAVMIIGCIPMGLAYPMHKLLLKENKRKYGAEIIRLSDELLNENKNA